MNILTLSNQNKTISNENITQESLHISESLCSESVLKFGCCEASVLKLQIRSDESVMGETFDVSMQEGSEATSLGSFTVYDEKLTSDKCYRDIEAYDAMYTILNADVSEWYKDLALPMTLAEFRYSFFNHLGIYQDEITLANDQMLVHRTIEPSSFQGKSVITAICELNGCFGHVGRDGIFHYIFLNSDVVNTISSSEMITSEYADFTTEYIDKLQIRQEENDIGTIYGTGDNCYIVQDNFLVYGKSSSELSVIASRLYSVISTVTYHPFNLQKYADLDLQVGDKVQFTTNETDIESFILKREISGIQSLKDSIQAQGEQLQSEITTSVSNQITQLKGKTNKLERSVEETRSEIEDVEEGLKSEIRQTTTAIEMQINNIQHELDGSISVYYREGAPTLLNYPAWDFTYNIPCDGTVQTTEDLRFVYTSEYYRKNIRAICYDEVNAVSYRFRISDSNTWYWEEITDSEFSVLMERITALEVSDGEIRAEVTQTQVDVGDLSSNVTTLSSQVTQTASSITSEVTRATNAESTLSSRITQTADSITSEVSRATIAEGNLSSRITQTANSLTSEITRAKDAEGTLSSKISQTENAISAEVRRASLAEGDIEASLVLKIDKNDNGQICSMLNAAADEITLTSNRLTIDSDNFKLAKNGSVTASALALTGGSVDIQGTYDGNPSNIKIRNGVIDAKGYFHNINWPFTYGYSRTIRSEDINGSGAYSDISPIGISAVYSDYSMRLFPNSLYVGKSTGNLNVYFSSSDGKFYTRVHGNLVVTGTKSRVVETQDYGSRMMNAYETPEPYFGDIGEDVIGDNGECIIKLDDIFSETICTEKYQVFLQAYGEGKLYVGKREQDHFVVKGTPGLDFSWEIKGKQKGFEDIRLEEYKENEL